MLCEFCKEIQRWVGRGLDVIDEEDSQAHKGYIYHSESRV